MEEAQLKPADYESMDVGDWFGPEELTVDAEMVRGFAYAEDDFNPWYIYSSPFGGPIAPSSLLVNDVLSLYLTKYDIKTDRGIHARQEIRFLEPIKVGQRVLCQARFAEKYIRRDKPYVITEGVVLAAEDGRKLVSVRGWDMVGMRPGLRMGAGTSPSVSGAAERAERVIPQADPGLAIVERTGANVLAGSPLPNLRKRISFKQMFVFSATPWAWMNMHTDPEYARSIGLPGPIAQGLMATGHMCELCTGFFGQAWFTSGRISPTYLQPFYAGDLLVTKGAVRDLVEEEGVTRLQLDLWCENAQGEVVAVARASARVG